MTNLFVYGSISYEKFGWVAYTGVGIPGVGTGGATGVGTGGATGVGTGVGRLQPYFVVTGTVRTTWLDRGVVMVYVDMFQL